MKRKILLIVTILIFLTGIGIMSYPLVSSVVNNAASRKSISDSSQQIEEIPDDGKNELLAQAEKYNRSLTDNIILTDPFDREAYDKIGADYRQAMDVDGEGLIGFLEIPGIDVYLAVRHGTSEEVLSKGAGHLQNTALPIGGESTHSVISAHSGYPGETFFDYLTDMEEGDEFYIHVLGKTLKYQVNQIKTVLPENTSDLRIVNGEDYVTLVTCTPYSINTHRLLVRGTRVDYDGGGGSRAGSSVKAGEDYLYVTGYRVPYWVAAAVMAVFLITAAVVVLTIIRRNKRKRPHTKAVPEAAGDAFHKEE